MSSLSFAEEKGYGGGVLSTDNNRPMWSWRSANGLSAPYWKLHEINTTLHSKVWKSFTQMTGINKTVERKIALGNWVFHIWIDPNECLGVLMLQKNQCSTMILTPCIRWTIKKRLLGFDSRVRDVRNKQNKYSRPNEKNRQISYKYRPRTKNNK